MSAAFNLDKNRIKHSFSLASATYDKVAALQRRVGSDLLDSINIANPAGTILDLGCGTGVLTGELLRTVPRASLQQIIALDIAWPMLHTSRNKLINHSNIGYVCADAELLPIIEKSVDLVFSSLALQWCRNLEAVFADIQRILKSRKQLVFSTFGPQTLKELKGAWAEVDDYSHVNEFYSAAQLKHFLQLAGFKDIRIKTKTYISNYYSVWELMRELKQLGAHNALIGRNKKITTRTHMQGMITAYEKHRSGELIPATFEVIIATAEV
ncbi:Malonyl-(acyl-carrier protein) O-methyltransferase [Candidatus Methylobacter favarea]|uniref:Malonyl-[acyl-carrier protein] O-methyltransferase n=1 Tax=Candidatus Methylobacter favarea TaxID=2707345 RepID=A0A8S0Y640_9GAMM|nr:malonyl-ACP O-methyltransferase BioC [Candidatus Methylobacter favarea]CAA9890433.1 Malonyl-(acyl-carrier protein) O-methyltransferase [Candidatus Methylobacter favarea]